MARITVFCLIGILAGCATKQETAESQALKKAHAKAVAAECKLYKGTGVTPKECKK